MTLKFLIVLRKELREALRDRRALVMLALFVVLYPALLWFSLHKMIEQSVKSESERMEVIVIGGAQVPNLLALLAQKNITIARHEQTGGSDSVPVRDDASDAQITALLKSKTFTAVLRVPPEFSEHYAAMRPAPIEVWSDSSQDNQRGKLRRLDNALRGYNNAIAASRLLAHGVSAAALSPINLQVYDTASSSSRSASLMGAMLGMFFATAFFFCMNTAMDSTAGERERRSLEVLLAQPAGPLSILVGKWLATATLAIVGLTLELLAAHLVLNWMPLEEIGMSWRMSLFTMLGLCLVSVPLCLFAAAIEIALAMNAKSFKEAQATMGFAMLVPMLPVIVVPSLNLSTSLWMYAVPVLANQTLLLELAKGQSPGASAYLLAAGSSLLLAALAIWFASWRLKSEKYVLGV